MLLVPGAGLTRRKGWRMKTILCGCRECAHCADGICTATAVLVSAGRARCMTREKTDARRDLSQETATELAAFERTAACANLRCLHNGGGRCRAERLVVGESSECDSFLAPG